MSENLMQELPLTAFGELATAELTPEVQISATNGLRDDVQQLFSGTGASIGISGNNYECISGTSPNGFSSVLSARFATYKNGQGLSASITALFSSSAENSLQLAGLINGANAFAFGYLGTSYGLGRAYNGAEELQTLLVTVPAVGSESATVTVNGVGYIVPLTVGTTEHNAIEIAVSLSSQISNNNFSANESAVTSLSAIPVAQGAFAFSSASAVAAWTQVTAGAPPIIDWIPLANWSNPPSWTIDPTKGNVYGIKVKYLGYGGIKFYMENPETTYPELVHVYEYSNEHTSTSVTDPTFRIGWVAQNLGNITPLSMGGASGMGGVEGKKTLDERGRPISNEVLSIGTTRKHVLSIRNRAEVAGKANRVTVHPQLLTLTAEHNKAVIFHVDIGVTFSDDVVYSYIDKTNSVIEFSKSESGLALDGREVLTVRVRGTAPVILDMEKILGWLLPRETLSITVETASAVGGEGDASLTWIEDI